MIRRILLADTAEQDIEVAAEWYGARASGLDARFLHALDEVLAFIAEHPNGAVRIKGRIREFPMRRFPYVVLFAVYPEEILVRRIFHTRQHPKRKLRRPR